MTLSEGRTLLSVPYSTELNDKPAFEKRNWTGPQFGEAIRRQFDVLYREGAESGRVMAIGEAPGADEDRQGLPFVGRSGQLFDRMLKAIGLDRSQVYIANVVPWRPPGNRTPSPQEVAVCLPFILRQIELADPAVVVCLGGSATQALLPVKDGILRLRGRWFDLDTGSKLVKTMPMLHPAYLLRTPAHKKQAWRDLRALRRTLDAL